MANSTTSWIFEQIKSAKGRLNQIDSNKRKSAKFVGIDNRKYIAPQIKNSQENKS